MGAFRYGRQYSDEEEVSVLLDQAEDKASSEQTAKSRWFYGLSWRTAAVTHTIILVLQLLLLSSWIHDRYFVLNRDLRRTSTFSTLPYLLMELAHIVLLN